MTCGAGPHDRTARADGDPTARSHVGTVYRPSSFPIPIEMK